MQEKIEKLCPQLSYEELEKVIFAKWTKAPNARATSINYSFHLNSIPTDLEKKLLSEYAGVSIQVLTESVREKVKAALELWRSACGEQIEFNYVEQLEANQPGITVIACDNLKNAAGVTYFNLSSSALNESNFNRVLVCVPSTISTAFNIKTLVHELGHALGLDHVHDVDSIKTRLMATKQGLGCSVMGYNSVLATADNNCTTEEYCYDQSYAIYPGPMDKQMCSVLYHPQFSRTEYFNNLFLGFLNGSIEKALSSFLTHLNYFHPDKKLADVMSLVTISLLRSQIQKTEFSLGNGLALLEIVAHLYKNEHVNTLHLLRVLANISSTLMMLYQTYDNEAALTKGIYLGCFLAAHLCGSNLGYEVGKKAANMTDTIVSKVATLFQWGKRSPENLPNSTNKKSLFSNWFFSYGKNVEATAQVDVQDFKLEPGEVDHFDQSNNQPAT